MTEPDLRSHEACATDLAGPRFDEEWQRRAFGVAVALSEFGHYRWDAFQEQLIAAIGAWERGGAADVDRPWSYYQHWLEALERVVVDHGLASPEELERLDGR